MKRKIECLFVILLCIISIFFSSPVTVYADEPGFTVDNVVKAATYLASTIGCILSSNYKDWYDLTIDYLERYNYTVNDFQPNNDGSLTFSDQMVDDFKEYLDSYFKETSDHWYEQTYSYSDCLDDSLDLGMLYSFSTLMNSKSDNSLAITTGIPIPSLSSAQFSRYNSSSVCYFVYRATTSTCNLYTAYDRYANRLSLSELGHSVYRFVESSNSFLLVNESSSGGSDPFVRFYSPSLSRTYGCVVSSSRTNVLCFEDLSALRRYVYGSVGSGDAHFATTSYLNYNPSIDNSITIDKRTVEYILNTENNFFEEIKNVSSSIQTEISNYYTENNTTMSNTQIQQTIDDSVHNYITSLPSGGNTEEPDKPPVDPDKPDPPGGDVSGNNPGGTVSGGSVSGNGVDGPQTVSFLSKIYLKLCEVYDFLSGSILDALKSIKNAIVANTLVDVAGGIADLISGGLDAVDGFMDDTAEAFSPVAEMLPEKFPTCIPWDLIAVFTVIVSSGSPPVYEVPVSVPSLGIDYTLTLDLSIFEPVATLCRAFLSLLMVMMLIHMTIRLTSSGGDN